MSQACLSRVTFRPTAIDGTSTAPISMTGWWVRLHGDETDLAQLARYSPVGRFAVIREDRFDGYLFTSDRIVIAPTARDASEVADVEVDELWGMCRLADQNCPRFHTGPVFYRRADGSYDIAVVTGTANLRMRGLRSTIIAGSGIPPPPPPQWKAYAELAAKHERVQRALWFFGLPDANTWVGLNRVLDVIKEDTGKLPADASKGWPSAKTIARFEHTANTFLAAGSGARHGRADRVPPARPMSIEDARDLISTLLARWVETKNPDLA